MNPTNPNNIFQAAGGVKTVTVEEEVAAAEKRVKAMRARVDELTAESKEAKKGLIEAKKGLISIKRKSMTERATKEELDEAAEEVTKKQKKLKDAQYAQMEGIAKLAVAVMELAEKKEEAKKRTDKAKEAPKDMNLKKDKEWAAHVLKQAQQRQKEKLQTSQPKIHEGAAEPEPER